jgi:adhesin transport system outer membrane protein
VGGYGRQRSDNTNTRGFNPDGTRNHNKETLNYTQSELRLRQMLFDGFNTANEVGRTEAVANSRAYYTQATAETVALRTIEVYLEVLKRRELVTLAKNNLQAHLRVNDQIGLRSARRGQQRRPRPVQRPSRWPRTTWTPPKSIWRRRNQLLQRGRAHARRAGNTGHDQGRSARHPAGCPPGHAREQPLPQVGTGGHQSAEQQYEVAKSPFYPRLDAVLATGANNNIAGQKGHDNNDWQAGVELSYNLFRGAATRLACSPTPTRSTRPWTSATTHCASSTKTSAWPGTP